MKLLLKRDIPRLGIVGDVVEVRDGYARNYLLPHHLAAEPTETNIRALADERHKAEERRRTHHESLVALAERLGAVEVTIAAAATKEGVLYGSVGPREVSAALRDDGIEVEASSIDLHTPIRRLDNVSVTVRLADDVSAEVKVWVVRSKGTDLEDDQANDGESVRDKTLDEEAGMEAGLDGDGADS